MSHHRVGCHHVSEQGGRYRKSLQSGKNTCRRLHCRLCLWTVRHVAAFHPCFVDSFTWFTWFTWAIEHSLTVQLWILWLLFQVFKLPLHIWRTYRSSSALSRMWTPLSFWPVRCNVTDLLQIFCSNFSCPKVRVSAQVDRYIYVCTSPCACVAYYSDLAAGYHSTHPPSFLLRSLRKIRQEEILVRDLTTFHFHEQETVWQLSIFLFWFSVCPTLYYAPKGDSARA